jgi:hypothetical protein
VRASLGAVPLETSVRFATREVIAREYVIVSARTRDGLVGHGYD